MNYLYFGIGTGLGAVIRFLTTNIFKQNNLGLYATFLVNMVGCLIAGIIFALNQNSLVIVGMFGFIGGLTTFSTFNAENANFYFSYQFKNIFIYMLSSYSLGLILCGLGFLLTSGLSK
ncbi:CrcB family protein [Fructilactobacillus vespulae]|uniref:fluoride efflux transporter FluC n=1 Tax=Fructilactobacillus vespulae TaxID=1249630 RepID=UPI0039B47C1E